MNVPPVEARLSSPVDIAGFRTEARELLAHQVPPEEVHWTAPVDGGTITALRPDAQAARGRTPATAASSIVPASFVRLCEYVVQHRDPDRFALLYRLLWRLVHEPGLRHDPGDADMARAQHMAHAVRRDIHKMKANLRFRDVQNAQGQLQLAWCEPAHHILETVAPWLAKRQPGARWAVMTPERSAYWDGKDLHYAAGSRPHLSSTATDADWLTRWQSLFEAAPAAR